jgi:negative regulator of flagellin synthesis FlgM
VKIENRDTSNNIQPYAQRIQDLAKRRDPKEPSGSHEAAADRLELSEAAKALQQTRQLLAEVPGVRLERVAELQAKIQGGLYNVRGEEVAAKMLRYGLFDGLI